MSIERTEMLGTARAEREALGRTIQYTPPDRWDADSASAGWRNRDVVAHVGASEVAAAAVLGSETASELEEYVKSVGDPEAPFSLDGFNEFTVARRRDVPFRQVVSEWGSAADLLLSRAGQVSEADWSGMRVRWVAGDIPTRYFVQLRVSEWWIHGEDIRAGAGLPARLEHPPIHAVNDLAIRTIPYALGLAGISHPGMSVLVELEGAGGGRWHHGLAPRDPPPRGKAPDAHIEGRAHAFAMVGGRRVSAEYYLDEGTLVVGGDDLIALDVLEHLRAFP
jgi:uncharacterized protein (TIGR03083 family)